MSFELVEYETLKEKIFESVRSLAKKHGYSVYSAKEWIDAYLKGNQNIEQLAKKYKKISQERRTEVGLLLTTIRCLESSNSTNKQVCLNAIAFYVMDLIEKSYDPEESWENYLASFGTEVSNSKLYVSLCYSLSLRSDKANYPSKQELYKMFTALKDLIMFHTYKNPEAVNMELLPLENQAFSSKKIEHFKLKDFFDDMIQRIAELDAARHHQATTAKIPIGSSPLSIFTPTGEKALRNKLVNHLGEPGLEGKELLDKENSLWESFGTSI